MKYIIIDNGMTEIPIIFSSALQHVVVASCLGSQIISAGFIQHRPDGFVCHGKSVSLDVNSRPEDGEFMDREFNIK